MHIRIRFLILIIGLCRGAVTQAMNEDIHFLMNSFNADAEKKENQEQQHSRNTQNDPARTFISVFLALGGTLRDSDKDALALYKNNQISGKHVALQKIILDYVDDQTLHEKVFLHKSPWWRCLSFDCMTAMASIGEDRLITAGKTIAVWDPRNLKKPLQKLPKKYEYHIQDIAAFGTDTIVVKNGLDLDFWDLKECTVKTLGNVFSSFHNCTLHTDDAGVVVISSSGASQRRFFSVLDNGSLQRSWTAPDGMVDVVLLPEKKVLYTRFSPEGAEIFLNHANGKQEQISVYQAEKIDKLTTDGSLKPINILPGYSLLSTHYFWDTKKDKLVKYTFEGLKGWKINELAVLDDKTIAAVVDEDLYGNNGILVTDLASEPKKPTVASRDYHCCLQKFSDNSFATYDSSSSALSVWYHVPAILKKMAASRTQASSTQSS